MALISQNEAGMTSALSSHHIVMENRSLYREESQNETKIHYGNIMYDRRVVRGNTYSLHHLQAAQAELAKKQKQEEQKRKAIARRRAREQAQMGTPDYLKGRQHMDVQTDSYLQDFIMMESEMQCQRDSIPDEPETPLFIPAMTCIDVATQIQDGDLFDFDREVVPIMRVLVGKVIEESLLEVEQEEELACLRAQQRSFEERQSILQNEVQRLQEQERRYTGEKERRIAQQEEAFRKEKEIAKKVAARAYTRQHLANLVPSIFTSLRCHGFFVDTAQADVEAYFMPLLLKNVDSTLDKKDAIRYMLNNMIKEACVKRYPEETNH